MGFARVIRLLLVVFLPYISIAQSPQPSTGSIRHFKKVYSKFVPARNISVWLPDGYDSLKRYAVVYMHDGKALFDSSIIWTKREWGVDETFGKLMAEKKIRDCIVVGIWNADAKRHSEYLPQKPFESMDAAEQDSFYNYKLNGRPVFAEKIQSENYLKFIVTELKPFIDSHFATLSNMQNTFIMGSSMGAMISLYAICEYPEVFGGAACMSTHWTGIFTARDNPFPAAMINYLKAQLPPPANHRIYFDYGSKTLDSLYKPFQLQVDAIMRSKGYSTIDWITKEFPGDDHSERSWKKRLPIAAGFLLGLKK